MDQELLRDYLENQAEMTFSRSSGPGGQNVNKTNTKVLLRCVLTEVAGLTEGEKERLRGKLAHRISGSGELAVQVQDQRSQLMNRQLAVERMMALISLGLKSETPRRASKPTRASKERRLQAKRSQSERKSARGRPQWD